MSPAADAASVAVAPGATRADDLSSGAGAPRLPMEPFWPEVSLLDQLQAAAQRIGQLSRVTVQLRPPELGTVAIAVESRDGDLRAHFHSSHPLAHAWLEANAAALRGQLADAGVALRDITFSMSFDQRGEQGQPGPGWTGEWTGPPGSAARPALQSLGRASSVAIGADSLVDWFA